MKPRTIIKKNSIKYSKMWDTLKTVGKTGGLIISDDTKTKLS